MQVEFSDGRKLQVKLPRGRRLLVELVVFLVPEVGRLQVKLPESSYGRRLHLELPDGKRLQVENRIAIGRA